MATIHADTKNGKPYFRLTFTINNKRKRINLGYSVSKKQQRKIQLICDELIANLSTGEAPSESLRKTLDSCSGELRQKFVKSGLLEEKLPTPNVETFFKQWMELKRKGDLRELTCKKYETTLKFFSTYFGGTRNLNSISKGDVVEFLADRKKDGASQSTLGTDIKRLKQAFNHAVDKEYISKSPFSEIKTPTQKLQEHRHDELDSSTLQEVIDGSPCENWKALISFVRWTGCRIGEALLMKWSDIDWELDRIKIPSPKTERYGVAHRIVPLWAELKPILLDYKEKFDPDSESYLVKEICNLPNKRSKEDRYSTNAGTHLKRVIERAGVKPWSRAWQAIRVFRENELELGGKFRTTAIRAWIGHSESVAMKHYSKITDSDFAAALEGSGGQIVASKELNQGASSDLKKKPNEETSLIQNNAAPCSSTTNEEIHLTGFEPVTFGFVDRCSIQLS